MGAADIVPGVSGGTIALVLGIYQHLIDSIRDGARALGTLAKGDVRGFVERLKALDFLFLIPLGTGIAVALVSLASVIEKQLTENPENMAGLFFGLVAASVFVAFGLLTDRTLQLLAIAVSVAVAVFFLLGFVPGYVVSYILKMLGMLRHLLAQEPHELSEDKLRQKIFHREEILDNVQKEITQFLSSLLSGSVPHDAAEEARRQVRMADEFESISDYVSNVLKMMMKLEKNGLDLTEAGRTELLELHDKVHDYVKMITEAVSAHSVDVLSHAYTQGDAVTYLMKECRRNHLQRLTEDNLSPLNTLIYIDMLNAYRRMRDHGLNVAEALCGEK